MPTTRLCPVLDGDFWTIGPRPDLADVLPGPDEAAPAHECVDHHVYRGLDGAWHLWGCIRGTPVGRILYRWQGDALEQANWRRTGEILRVDHEAGESLED